MAPLKEAPGAARQQRELEDLLTPSERRENIVLRLMPLYRRFMEQAIKEQNLGE